VGQQTAHKLPLDWGSLGRPKSLSTFVGGADDLELEVRGSGHRRPWRREIGFSTCRTSSLTRTSAHYSPDRRQLLSPFMRRPPTYLVARHHILSAAMDLHLELYIGRRRRGGGKTQKYPPMGVHFCRLDGAPDGWRGARPTGTLTLPGYFSFMEFIIDNLFYTFRSIR
jgi:hypothetical protein